MIGFKVETELLGDEIGVVSVAGELDMYTAPTFALKVNDALDNGYARVVIDLTACGFLDSTALGILVSANGRLGGEKGRLTLVTDDHNIVKAFQITGLDRRFTIVPTRAAALNGATLV